MRILYPVIGVFLLLAGLITITWTPAIISQAMLTAAAGIFAINTIVLDEYVKRLKRKQKMPDSCCGECPHFYGVEYRHLLELDRVLKDNSKSVSSHTHSLLLHLKYACEVWEQNRLVVALLNALPEDNAIWEDPSQARKIEDAIAEVVKTIGAIKNEDGLYALKEKK